MGPANLSHLPRRLVNTVQGGWVRDATWEPDTDRQDTYIELMAYLGDNGAITWTEPEFEQER